MVYQKKRENEKENEDNFCGYCLTWRAQKMAEVALYNKQSFLVGYGHTCKFCYGEHKKREKKHNQSYAITITALRG